MSIWTRIKGFGPWSRAQRGRDLDREIRNHLDLEAEESGPHSARRTFGNAMLVKEDVRLAWGWTRFEQLAGDVRNGLRQVRRNPRSRQLPSRRWRSASASTPPCSAPSMRY